MSVFSFLIFSIGCSEQTESSADKKLSPVDKAQQACTCIVDSRANKQISTKEAAAKCQQERESILETLADPESQEAFEKSFHQCIGKMTPPLTLVDAAKWGLPNLPQNGSSKLKHSVISKIRVLGENIFVGIKMDYFCQLEPQFEY